MADNVNITGAAFGANLPKWATEETMKGLKTEVQNLVKSLQKQAGVKAKGGDRFSKNIEETSESSKSASKSLNIFSKELEDSAKETEENIKRLQQSLETGSEDVSELGGISGLVSGTMSKMISPIGLLTSGFALATGAITLFRNYLVETTTAFLDLYDTGITLQRGLFDFRLAAAEAAMPLSEFSRILVENSALVASFGEGGARALGQISRQTRELLHTQGFYGTTLKELNDYTTGYLETLRLQGFLLQMTQEERSRATANYVKDLTVFSQVLGKSRKIIDEEIKQAARRPDVFAKLQTLSNNLAENAVDVYMRATGAFAGALGDQSESFNEIFGSLIVAVNDYESDFIKILSMANPQLANNIMDFANSIGRGEANIGDVNERVADILEGFRSLTKEEKQAISQLIETRSQFSEGAIQFAQIFRTAETISADALTRLRTRQEQELDEISKTFIRLQESFRIVTASFEQVFARFLNDNVDTLERVAKGIADMAQGFAEHLEKILVQVSRIFDPETREAAVQEIKDLIVPYIADVVTSIFDFIADYIINKITGRDVDIEALTRTRISAAQAIPAGAERERIIEILGQEGISYDPEEYRQQIQELARLQQQMGMNLSGVLQPLISQSEEFAKEWRKAQLAMEHGRYVAAFANLESRLIDRYARGGIAEEPSIFGEAGPEAAIPLDQNRMIPVANVDVSGLQMRSFSSSMRNVANEITEALFEGRNIVTKMDPRMLEAVSENNRKITELVSVNEKMSDSLSGILNKSVESTRRLGDVRRSIKNDSNNLR